jgi:hypothetical protein
MTASRSGVAPELRRDQLGALVLHRLDDPFGRLVAVGVASDGSQRELERREGLVFVLGRGHLGPLIPLSRHVQTD